MSKLRSKFNKWVSTHPWLGAFIFVPGIPMLFFLILFSLPKV